MSFKSKFKKLITNPTQFFLDMSIIKETDFIKEINEKKRLEPLILGDISCNVEDLTLNIKKTSIKNSKLGFSSLVILNNVNEEYIIHNQIAKSFLLDKKFIGFREKTLFFLIDNSSNPTPNLDNISVDFLSNNNLRSNPFVGFRNIISINPLSLSSFYIRETNPILRNIIIVNNQTILNNILDFQDKIDVLIYEETLKLPSYITIPKQLKYNDSIGYINELKIVIVDNSYKLNTSNLLIPIFNNEDNFEKLDFFNNTNTQGLIEFKTNVFDNKTSNDVINNMEISKLFLREDLYNLYKDKIYNIQNENDLKDFFKLTLKEGVFYEKI